MRGNFYVEVAGVISAQVIDLDAKGSESIDHEDCVSGIEDSIESRGRISQGTQNEFAVAQGF